MPHEPVKHPNRGRSPRDHTIPLGIEWVNGMTSKHTFTADKLRWTLTDSPFDVGRFWKAEGK